MGEAESPLSAAAIFASDVSGELSDKIVAAGGEALGVLMVCDFYFFLIFAGGF